MFYIINKNWLGYGFNCNPNTKWEKNIEKTLLKIERISKKVELDIIIVDDNSKDKTLEIAQLFKNKLNIKLLKMIKD